MDSDLKTRNLKEWLSWQEQLHLSEIDLGLERIKIVAQRLNLLSPAYPIITVAGTNGKGSTVAFLESILTAEGYKTGSYTSPHLIEYNERIKLNGVQVSDAQIIDAFEKIDKARGDISLTYFEFGTLAAMLCFTQINIDIAILEVGLGGRLDAANLWDASVAVITNIGIDHIDWLGDDREKIGYEKAGIMRESIDVICGDIEPPASLSSEAKRIGANLKLIGKDFSFKTNNKVLWTWENNNTNLKLPYPSLAGVFQLNNAATAIAALDAVHDIIPVSHSSIQKGLQEAFVLGRLQTINKSPEWLIDVAHNPHAAKELAKHLESNLITGNSRALFSMLKDKDICKVISLLDQYFDEWHIFPVLGSRGLSIQKLSKHMKQQKIKGMVIRYDNFDDACLALKKVTKTKDRVVAFGSFLVVSQVLDNCK